MAQFDSIRFTPGRPLTKELGSERLNAIITEIKRNKPKGERGITVRQDGTGTYIGLAASLPRGGSASTPADTHPFQVASFVDPDADPENENPPCLATVRPGATNQIIASNHFDGDALREFAVSANTLTYIVLTVTTNGKEITSATLSVTTTAPVAQQATLFALPTEIKYTLALVYNTSVYQIQKTNFTIAGKIVYTKDKTTPAAPGQLPFEIWYVWQ
jgi:hypothetical protein